MYRQLQPDQHGVLDVSDYLRTHQGRSSQFCSCFVCCCFADSLACHRSSGCSCVGYAVVGLLLHSNQPGKLPPSCAASIGYIDLYIIDITDS